ncbi:uracil permease [Thozetella sp. PMI_491]|nr:uracil permease [Thozetella sp. PMI_491]
MAAGIIERLEVPHPRGEPRPTALISHDTKPIEKERRLWGTASFFGLWTVTAFNMSNFQLGSSMLSLGLNWWQTIVTTLFGHIFGAILVVIVSQPGLQYYISFPVVSRIGWGFLGSVFVVINRIFLSVLWTGVQSWLGGLVTYVCIRAIWPSIDEIPNTIPISTGMTLPQFVGFIVFYIIQFPLFLLSPITVRYLLLVGSVAGFLVQLVLLAWACGTMGEAGFGTVLSGEVELSGSRLAWMSVYAISLTVSSVTSGTLSICDYARFSKSVSAGTWSQLAGWVPMWLSNVFGVLTVAATQNRFGTQLWNAAGLLIVVQDANPTSGTRAAVFFAGFAMALSQLSLNILGNSFSGGTDMSALVPRWINIRRGQIITALLGLVINPWYLLSNATVFLSVMSSYTVFLQPLLGILVAQYFVVQKKRLRVSDLYIFGPESIYWYDYGVNWRAVVAWAVGMAPHVPGFISVVNSSLIVPAGAVELYYLSPFTGFFIGFIVTIVLDIVSPVKRQKEFIQSTTPSRAMALYEESNYVTSSAIIDGVGTEIMTVSSDIKDKDSI